MKKQRTKSERKIKLKQEISEHMSDLKQFVKESTRHRKDYEENDIENPDAEECHRKLFDTVDWLVEHCAYDQIGDVYNELNDDEIEAMDNIIHDIVYRFEYPVKDSKGDIDSIVVTPFAIPIMIMVPIIYRDRVPRLKELNGEVTERSSAKLLRNCLNLGAEPTVIIDGRLWRNDEAGWEDFDAVIQYIKGFVMYVSNLSPTVSSLKVRSVRNRGERAEEKDGMYCFTRTITGMVMSGDVNIDLQLFGYNDAEKGIVENHFANEFAIICESDLNSVGIKGAKVLLLSQWPIELWEVPETVISFVHILYLRKEAARAESETPYSGGNRTLKILIYHKNDAVDVKLSVYDDCCSEPFFKYTWDVVYGLETPESVLDNIMRICKEELRVNNMTLDYMSDENI